MGQVALATVILAGGASRRMGRDKASLVLDGTQGATLLERAVVAARSAGADQIVVVGTGRSRPPMPYGGFCSSVRTHHAPARSPHWTPP